MPSDSPLRPLPPPPGDAARELGRALSLTTTVADLLYRRGHFEPGATQRFLEPKLADLTPPDGMADRALAAERIVGAVKRGERICVFGDYDCDGITSAAIMTELCRAVGGEVVPLLASRFDGGYGVSPAAVERIVASGARLLVTCDCGSSDHATLADVRSRGIDIIVIDHHLVPPEPLPALAFLNPHRDDCAFPYKGLASCGLALSVGAALRAELLPGLDLRQWLDLVAIGTIADVAPLDGDNRALVRAGLARLAEGRRPGVRALCELAKIDASSPLTGEDVAFRIAPRINAPGRLGPPDLALELLLSRTHEEARALAASIEQLQTERRAQQERILAEAVEEIEREGWAERPAIVVGREGWNHGIVGIAAGRLASRYGRPVIVVGFDGERGRGSVRGPEGARLHDALRSASEALERYGGHQAAAGVEVRLARLGELRERFEHACANQEPAEELAAAADVAWLCPEDEPGQVVSDLMRLEPCGAGNPAPQVIVRAEVVSSREVRGGHLKLELSLAGGQRMGAFGVRMGDRAESLTGQVLVVGRLRRDTWRGAGAVEIRADEIHA
jgi:single-stranded-DNA-specific exonuclease